MGIFFRFSLRILVLICRGPVLGFLGFILFGFFLLLLFGFFCFFGVLLIFRICCMDLRNNRIFGSLYFGHLRFDSSCCGRTGRAEHQQEGTFAAAAEDGLEGFVLFPDHGHGLITLFVRDIDFQRECGLRVNLESAFLAGDSDLILCSGRNRKDCLVADLHLIVSSRFFRDYRCRLLDGYGFVCCLIHGVVGFCRCTRVCSICVRGRL